MMKHFPSGLEDHPKQGEGFADFRSRAGEPIDMSYRKRLEHDATARPPLMATCSWDLAVQLVALVLSTPKEVRLGRRRLILHCSSEVVSPLVVVFWPSNFAIWPMDAYTVDCMCHHPDQRCSVLRSV